MAQSYYIPQFSAPFSSIPMGGSTVSSIGCAVCCCAMVMCARLKVSDDATKVEAVKKIISSGTTNGNLLHDFTVTWKNETFRFQKTTTKPNYASFPVIQCNGHFVLAISATMAQDPGKGSSAPTSENTIANYDKHYGTQIAWWKH